MQTVQQPLSCEVCGATVECVVVCVPGVPFSCRYCSDCLAANAHPWWILVMNTVCAGGRLEDMIDEWVEMVEDTCKHLGRTVDQFKTDVADGMKKLEEDMRSHGMPVKKRTRRYENPL